MTVESSLNFTEDDELTASRRGGKREVPSVAKRMLAEQEAQMVLKMLLGNPPFDRRCIGKYVVLDHHSRISRVNAGRTLPASNSIDSGRTISNA